MKPAAFLAVLVFFAASLFGAEGAPPANYKAKILESLAAKNPQYSKFYCDYSEPKRVLVGDAKKTMCAVRCEWSAKRKGGSTALMIVQGTFLFDGDKMIAAERGEKLEWVDGEPTVERKTHN